MMTDGRGFTRSPGRTLNLSSRPIDDKCINICITARIHFVPDGQELPESSLLDSPTPVSEVTATEAKQYAVDGE